MAAAVLAGLMVGALLLGACGGDGGSSSTTTPEGEGSTVTGKVTVLAAASLSGVFPKIGDAFTAANPGASVELSFAGSSTLATQIRQGAPADVFASADTTTMDGLVQAGLASGAPTVFATNQLAIIVEKGNPKGITSLADLARPGVLYVTAAPEVPIARYSADALQRAGVTVTPVSQEADVKGIVTKVTAGEADAGIVYTTDVAAAGDKATGIALPGAGVVATYPAAVLSESTQTGTAAAFVQFLRSPTAQELLAAAGFGRP